MSPPAYTAILSALFSTPPATAMRSITRAPGLSSYAPGRATCPMTIARNWSSGTNSTSPSATGTCVRLDSRSTTADSPERVRVAAVPSAPVASPPAAARACTRPALSGSSYVPGRDTLPSTVTLTVFDFTTSTSPELITGLSARAPSNEGDSMLPPAYTAILSALFSTPPAAAMRSIARAPVLRS
ncbi:MAG: hypothetical protein BWY85_01740 [Firmicutes bacterium ADurb.Bin506]|nr:MAG: hypothetical protein BWY85_01740 [Firmicutes bacterium ADurb.Bin506]